MNHKNFGLGNIIKQSKENTPLADKALADKQLEESVKTQITNSFLSENNNDSFLAPLGGRKGRKVNLELTDIQFNAIDVASKHSRYSKREIMVMALRDYLQKHKYI